MALAGILAFVLQQVSLSIGQLAATVATVSVANPVVSVLIGILLFDERLSRPAWHVLIAVVGLALAFVGAVAISGAATVGPSLLRWAGRRRQVGSHLQRYGRRRAADTLRVRDAREIEIDRSGKALADRRLQPG